MKSKLPPKRILLICLILASVFHLHAQKQTVSGTVMSDEGLPMPGVSVTLQNPTTGTVTDENGKFSLLPFEQLSAQQIVSVGRGSNNNRKGRTEGINLQYLRRSTYQVKSVPLAFPKKGK